MSSFAGRGADVAWRQAIGAMLNVLKGLKPWRIGVLVAALLGAAGGTYGVYTLISGSGQVALEEDQWCRDCPGLYRRAARRPSSFIGT